MCYIVQEELQEVNPCDEVIEDGIAVESLIYLRCRPLQEKTAVLLSCLSNGTVRDSETRSPAVARINDRTGCP